MSDSRTLVAEAIAETRIHSPVRYSWFGAMSPRLPVRVARTLSPPAARRYLVHLLAGQLYGDFYRRGKAEPPRWSVRGPAAGSREFEAALSAANCGRGYLDEAWQVRGSDERGVIVAKNGLELTVDGARLARPGTAAGVPAAGDLGALRLPKELFAISPGFYVACADRPFDTTRSRRMVRLYWNLRGDGAVPFVAAATRALNCAGAAFRLKVLNDPGAFSRCDAAVIYLTRDDYPELADLILALHGEIGGFLSPRTPVFTARLAPGVGFAEDPGTAESFGEHRCRLLADALARSHESGTVPLAAVEERFAEDGLDLDAAHLSPGPAADLMPVP
jgi:hypothetical protein